MTPAEKAAKSAGAKADRVVRAFEKRKQAHRDRIVNRLVAGKNLATEAVMFAGEGKALRAVKAYEEFCSKIEKGRG
jgi:hypothetical protein